MKSAKIKDFSTKLSSKGKKLKALVLFSGGLDSRVTAKFMEELGFEVHLGFVKLAFGSGCGNFDGVEEYASSNEFKLHIIDASKGDLLKEYLELVKKPKHGYGTAMNPCKDCKIFIFKQGKKLASEIDADVICTGEVMGQRPMSQMKKALLLDEKEAGLTGKILRPLSAKLLPETEYEKAGLIDRSKLFEIHGRRRDKQMQLADKYKISYPSPGGGCLLCEDLYSKKLNALLKYKKVSEIEEIYLLKKGRMFKKEGLIFVGSNSSDNSDLKELATKLKWKIFFRDDKPGPTIAYDNEKDYEIIEDLWEAYSGKDLKEREKFDKFKI